jgi:M6 family metalloprotease-like protein
MERTILSRRGAFLAVCALLGGAVWAQSNSRAGEVRQNTSHLLKAMSQVESLPANQRANERARAAPVFAARAEALEALIQSSPSEALGLALPAETLASLAAAFPDSAQLLETRGTWQGEVEYTILDSHDLSSSESRIRIDSGQGMLEVHIAGAEPPGLSCGAHMRVKGIRVKTRVAALDGDVQTTQAAALTCSPTGNQNVAVILATFPGVTPPNITPAGVHNMLFGSSGRSVDGYWREASYGQAWATGDVVGWYTLDKLYTCDSYYDMLAAAIRAADADINFLAYNRVFVIFPNPGSCGWAGLSNVGCGRYSSPGDGSFTASASWMLANYFTSTDSAVKLAVHEGGHGLGLMHSRSRDFGGEALGAIGATGTTSEYGDLLSAMGSWNLGHYTVEQKIKLGWLPGSNVTQVQDAGSFTVLRTETPAAGTQALKVQRGTGNSPWLYVEYRQPVGNYDSTLPSQAFGGALIHYYDGTSGGRTDLLDFTPATSSFSDGALPAGATWSDPYSNLSLQIGSASSNGLNVQVAYGPLPCTRAAPTVSASPLNPSAAAGNSASYTVSVKNNDSSGCAGSTFSLGSALPQGWSTSFSTSALTLSPGQSGSASMTKTVPASMTPGTYAVDLTAAGPSLSGQGAANLTVTAPPPPVSVSVASEASSYAAKSTAALTAKVLSGANPASGASVVFTLTKPGGATATQSAKTDASGTATWRYRFSPKDPLGTYTVSAQATFGGQTASSNSASFSLQ